MKAALWIKFCIYLPLIFLFDYLVMVLLGCSTCLLGFGDDYYCGKYCIIGKIILVISAAFFLFLVYPDIRNIFKKNGHA